MRTCVSPLENSVFVRIIGAVGLLIIGSYLLAVGLSDLVLLPLVVAVAGLSGAQATAQVQTLQNQIIAQLAFGIVCVAGSALIAFFKPETLRTLSPFPSPQMAPQNSIISALTTEQLMAELKLRMPRT